MQNQTKPTKFLVDSTQLLLSPLFFMFLIYSATLCLWTGDLNPFTFKETTEKEGFTIAILLIPSLSLNSFALLLSSFLFYWIFYWHAFPPPFFFLCSFCAYFLWLPWGLRRISQLLESILSCWKLRFKNSKHRKILLYHLPLPHLHCCPHNLHLFILCIY